MFWQSLAVNFTITSRITVSQNPDMSELDFLCRICDKADLVNNVKILVQYSSQKVQVDCNRL